MAIYQGATQVVTNTPDIDWNRLTGLPAGLVTAVSVSSTGDNEHPIATPFVRVDSVSFASGTLSINFDTNCQCACVCLCVCGS